MPLPVQIIERRIYLIRTQKVMLDRDLAELYAVRAIALRQQVKRNRDRFPADFMFQLSAKEAELLVSQNVIPSGRSYGGSLPYAFTEQGVAMLSSVLRSTQAVQVNIAIMRAFVKVREILATHKDLAHKLQAIEGTQKEHGANISAIWKAIQKLVERPNPTKPKIGFQH